MTDNKLYVYEAFCGAFYRVPFADLLGEQDTPEGRTAYFHLGEKKPKDMRVSVILCKDQEQVIVRAEWRNVAAGGSVLKGVQNWVMPCYSLSQMDARIGTEDIVVKVLEVFKQVLEGTGVAGKIDALAPPEEQTTDA